MNESARPLLSSDEPAAVEVAQEHGSSDLLLICDHASPRIPRSLGSLGMSAAELRTHIAWDIGAACVARSLSIALDATLVLQNYSRLVIDCNRRLAAADSIATRSEDTTVEANLHLDPIDIAARQAGIFAPYHQTVASILDRRQRASRRTLLIAVHSFTPAYRGVSRPWHIGVMHRSGSRLGTALLTLLSEDATLHAGNNQPYAIAEDVDYSLPVHGGARGIEHAGLEIRQDLIADEAGQKEWATRLTGLLTQSVRLASS